MLRATQAELVRVRSAVLDDEAAVVGRERVRQASDGAPTRKVLRELDQLRGQLSSTQRDLLEAALLLQEKTEHNKALQKELAETVESITHTQTQIGAYQRRRDDGSIGVGGGAGGGVVGNRGAGEDGSQTRRIPSPDGRRYANGAVSRGLASTVEVPVDGSAARAYGEAEAARVVAYLSGSVSQTFRAAAQTRFSVQRHRHAQLAAYHADVAARLENEKAALQLKRIHLARQAKDIESQIRDLGLDPETYERRQVAKRRARTAAGGQKASSATREDGEAVSAGPGERSSPPSSASSSPSPSSSSVRLSASDKRRAHLLTMQLRHLQAMARWEERKEEIRQAEKDNYAKILSAMDVYAEDEAESASYVLDGPFLVSVRHQPTVLAGLRQDRARGLRHREPRDGDSGYDDSLPSALYAERVPSLRITPMEPRPVPGLPPMWNHANPRRRLPVPPTNRPGSTRTQRAASARLRRTAIVAGRQSQARRRRGEGLTTAERGHGGRRRPQTAGPVVGAT